MGHLSSNVLELPSTQKSSPVVYFPFSSLIYGWIDNTSACEALLLCEFVSFLCKGFYLCQVFCDLILYILGGD